VCKAFKCADLYSTDIDGLLTAQAKVRRIHIHVLV